MAGAAEDEAAEELGALEVDGDDIEPMSWSLPGLARGRGRAKPLGGEEPVAHPDLVVDVRDMLADRRRGDAQGVPDVVCGPPGRQQLVHLPLTCRQPIQLWPLVRRSALEGVAEKVLEQG